MINGSSDDSDAKEALAAFGLRLEQQAAPARLVIWPDNEFPVAVFRRCFTQWYRAGTDGRRTGLRYDQARIVFDSIGGPPQDWPDTLDGLQVMEYEALEMWLAQAR